MADETGTIIDQIRSRIRYEDGCFHILLSFPLRPATMAQMAASPDSGLSGVKLLAGEELSLEGVDALDFIVDGVPPLLAPMRFLQILARKMLLR